MKTKHIVIFIIVITLAGIGYFVFDVWNKYASGAKSAMAYTVLAIGNQDTVSFKKHVEIDSITTDVLNNIHLLDIDSVQKQQMVMMSVFNRPALIAMAHEATMDIIAGKEGGSSEGNPIGLKALDELLDTEKNGFELVEISDEIMPGDSIATVHVVIKTQQPKLDLDISLRARKQDGEWQITRINNFVELANKVLATVKEDA